MKYSTAVPIGRGAAGEVLEAWDPRLERPVALKLLRRDDPGGLERTLREARVQASVEHPNVCRVYDVGETADGRPFIAMQLVRGKPLTEALAGRSWEEKVLVLATVAEAVQAAHAVGLIHRDLKPANILVEEADDGLLTPYVLDFGIARQGDGPGLTRTGQAMGTPGYMSPEQALGEQRQIDRRTDVFALGIILYELLAARLPYRGSSPAAILVELLRGERTSLRKIVPGLSVDLDRIVQKCLEHDPRRRYESAAALVADLRRWLAGEPVEARAPSMFYRLSTRMRRQPRTAAALALALAIVVLAVVILVRNQGQAREQARLADRFGGTVEKIETQLRLAFMLAPHDVRPDLAEAALRLEELQAEVDEVGPLARGPGNVAVGRGMLRLGRVEESRGRLEAAWRSGYRTPGVALSLGMVLGEQLSRRLAEIDRIEDATLRSEERRRAEKELAEPAGRYLELARADLSEQEEHERILLDGLLALAHGDLATARQRGREATLRRTWFYEGDLLAAEADFRAASQARLANRWQLAEEALQELSTALSNALEKAPSDPTARRLRCEAGALAVAVDRERGLEIAAPYESARRECGLALEVLPEAGELLESEAYLVNQWATDLLQRGLDPDEALAELETTVRQGLAAQEPSRGAIRHLASFYWIRAQRRFDQNQEYGDDADRAVELYRQAVAADPTDGALRLETGRVLTRVGQWRSFAGADPLESWNTVLAILEPIQSEDLSLGGRVQVSRCGVLTEIGYHLFQREGDDRNHLQEAAHSCREALRIAPESLRAWSRLGYAEWSRAEMQVALGADPTASFEAAAEAYDRVLGRSPERMPDRVNLAHLLEEHAAWGLSRGSDPEKLLRRAENETERFRDVYPADYHLIQGKIELVRARTAGTRLDAESWDRAAEHALAYTRLAPEQVVGHELLADVCRRHAEALLVIADGGISDPTLAEVVRRGLGAAEEALEQSPDLAEALASRAVLQAVRSRLSADEPERESWWRAARASLAAAVRQRPDLASDLESSPAFVDL